MLAAVALRMQLFSVAAMQAMSDIWGSGEHVQCIHPAAGCIAGRENVSTASTAEALSHQNKVDAAQSATDLSCEDCADLRSTQKRCAGLHSCVLRGPACFVASAGRQQGSWRHSCAGAGELAACAARAANGHHRRGRPCVCARWRCLRDLHRGHGSREQQRQVCA